MEINKTIEIKKIGAQNAEDANIKNQPFKVWGKMIPALDNGVWTYSIKKFGEAAEMCFPDFTYDPDDGGAYFGAYDKDKCIGLAVLRPYMFRYMYLEDLKVDRDHRGRGIGKLLIDACMKEARENGKQGVYTIAQDNNLSACLFYLKCGFEIGGFDNRAYRGTPQEHKADIYLYRDCE